MSDGLSYGYRRHDHVQPLEWFGDDLEQGLEHVENAAYSMVESGTSSSLIEDLPMLDPLSHRLSSRRQSPYTMDGASKYSST